VRVTAAAVALCLLAASAASAFVAKLSVEDDARSLTGALDCTPGGAVTGAAAVSFTATDQTGPLLTAGGRAPGRYQLAVRITAQYAAAGADDITGTATLYGDFTNAEGMRYRAQGIGRVSGGGSVAEGTVTLKMAYDEVTFDGGALVSPQPLSLLLPPFAVENAAGPNVPGATVPAATEPTTPGAEALHPLPPPTATTPATPAGEPTSPLPTPAATPAAPAATEPATNPWPEGTLLGHHGTLEAPALKVVLGDRRTADNRGVEATSTMPATASLLYLYIQARQAPPQGQLLVTLYYGIRAKQRSLLPAQAGDEFVVTFYPEDAEVFPPGAWSVVLKAGEQVLGALPFTVGP
jgi:hypothetical protein